MSEYLVGVDVEHDSDQLMAEQMLRTLIETYPGYAWFVLIRGGVVQIKNLDWSDSWGMALHYSDLAHDATERSRKLKQAAGEFLERANMIRGRKREGERLEAIEGVPDSHLNRAKVLGA